VDPYQIGKKTVMELIQVLSGLVSCRIRPLRKEQRQLAKRRVENKNCAVIAAGESLLKKAC
jgi:hypothetical protein